MIDDTALPKKGTRYVGVAYRSCGSLGNRTTGQQLVSLTLTWSEVAVAFFSSLLDESAIAEGRSKTEETDLAREAYQAVTGLAAPEVVPIRVGANRLISMVGAHRLELWTR